MSGTNDINEKLASFKK